MRKRMVYNGAASQDKKKICLTVVGPAYLGAEERRRAGWWRLTLCRVLQSTGSGLWRRIRLASYLGLQSQATQRFCAHVVAAAQEARREEAEAEKAAMDRLCPHIMRELLAQNRGLLVCCEHDRVRVLYPEETYEKHWKHRSTLRRDRNAIVWVVFCFRAREEVEGALLRTIWKSMRFMFPKTDGVELESLGWRECLYKLEVEAMLVEEGVNVIGIDYGIGRCPIREIDEEKLSAVKRLGIFGAEMSRECIRRISVSGPEDLELGICWGVNRGLLRWILQGEVSRGPEEPEGGKRGVLGHGGYPSAGASHEGERNMLRGRNRQQLPAHDERGQQGEGGSAEGSLESACVGN